MDIQAAKAEINMTILSMMQGVYIIGALIVAGYMFTVRNDAAELKRTILALCVSLVFLIAQHDHKIFRLGYWLRMYQDGFTKTNWEAWKTMLKSRFVVMPIVDTGMAVAPLYVAWRMLTGIPIPEPYFSWAVGILISLGIVMVVIGQLLAGW